MTIIICANLKYYSLILADTRASWIEPIKGFCYEDKDHKIVNCSIGLVTGSGNADYLKSVKNKLLNTKIQNTDQIIEIINNECKKHYDLFYKDLDLQKEHNAFIISYLTLFEDKFKIRLALFEPNTGNQFKEILKSYIIIPADLKLEGHKKYSKILAESIKIPEFKNTLTSDKTNNTLNENLRDNTLLFIRIFKDILSKSRQISSDYDIAIMDFSQNITYIYGDINAMNGPNDIKISVISKDTNILLKPDLKG